MGDHIFKRKVPLIPVFRTGQQFDLLLVCHDSGRQLSLRIFAIGG